MNWLRCVCVCACVYLYSLGFRIWGRGRLRRVTAALLMIGGAWVAGRVGPTTTAEGEAGRRATNKHEEAGGGKGSGGGRERRTRTPAA